MFLAQRYLARHPSPLAAYLALQRDVTRRYTRRFGGTPLEFVDLHHGTLRRAFGWMIHFRP